MIEELRDRVTAELERIEGLGAGGPALVRAMGEMDEAERERLRLLRCIAAGLDKVTPAMVPEDRVGFGSIVKVLDIRSREEYTYTLVSGTDIDIDAGEVSLGSPVAQALLGRKEGEEVEVVAPQHKRRLKVIDFVTVFERLGAHTEPTPPEAA